jgi:uncharacterized protein YndB with AHSA1/START domain
MPTTPDKIEKEVILDAPRSRVWQAITTVREFNEWFGVALTGEFKPGAEVSGRITTPGYDHLTMTVFVETVEPEHHFSFRWHPYAVDESADYRKEPTTLITFRLEDVPDGTRLTVTESGFDAIPEHRRIDAFRSNAEGWAIQVENIRKHLAASPVR